MAKVVESIDRFNNSVRTLLILLLLIAFSTVSYYGYSIYNEKEIALAAKDKEIEALKRKLAQKEDSDDPPPREKAEKGRGYGSQPVWFDCRCPIQPNTASSNPGRIAPMWQLQGNEDLNPVCGCCQHRLTGEGPVQQCQICGRWTHRDCMYVKREAARRSATGETVCDRCRARARSEKNI